MYLFNNHEGCINKQINRLPVAAISILGKQRTHFDILSGEENPRSIASLLLILVLLLHLYGALWLLQPHAGETFDDGSISGFRSGPKSRNRAAGTAQTG
jgi:hypothetical protein